MIFACTLCDNKYIHHGLNLYSSLVKNSGDEFLLFWLCLDDEIFLRLSKMGLNHVLLFRVSDLEDDWDLASIRKLPNTKYGDDHANFCWRLPPIFIDHLLDNHVPDGQKLIYADSDIFFYRSPAIILDIIQAESKSVGIHTHRFSSPYTDETDNGWYNVGVMVFVSNPIGKMVCQQWHYWMANPDTEIYKKFGTCGDQKWLNLFIPTFGHSNICVFDEEGDCGHLAPWNCTGVSHPQKHYIIYKGRLQPVVFFHFSHFTVDNGRWRDSYHGEWTPAADPNIRPYYEDYFTSMQSLTKPTA